jgi:hypothetical protein
MRGGREREETTVRKEVSRLGARKVDPRSGSGARLSRRTDGPML